MRGEGAVLLNKHHERFTNELLPRDLLSIEIQKQMAKDHSPFVWEDLRTIPADEVREHFPNIVEHCASIGYDVFKEPIPVVPAQHYFMGGIWVNHHSMTSMQQLYAIGETACNGVHGKNRLASNSLLESLVFAKRAAKDCLTHPVMKNEDIIKGIDLEQYQDLDALEADYAKCVKDEIDRVNKEAAHV